MKFYHVKKNNPKSFENILNSFNNNKKKSFDLHIYSTFDFLILNIKIYHFRYIQT